MPLSTEAGTKIIFMGQGGCPDDLEFANEHLELGNVYTVKSVDVDPWDSSVELKEIDNTWFNPVHFKVRTSQSPKETTNVSDMIWAKIAELEEQLKVCPAEISSFTRGQIAGLAQAFLIVKSNSHD